MSVQKEIIHLSFGTFSNHLSTHFWNQQTSYFTYDDSTRRIQTDRQDDVDESNLVDHDVSFRMGQSITGNETYTPRVLLFDVRQEFGSLAMINPLYNSLIESDESSLRQEAIGMWGAQVDVVREKRVTPSRYQARLEREEEEGHAINSEDEDDDEEEEEQEQERKRKSGLPSQSTLLETRSKSNRKTSKYRFWSDYSRVYYHPKSMVHVGGQLMAPMSGSYNGSIEEEQDGRTRFERFDQGCDYFDQLEKESEIVEGNLRWFTEDTDLLQGFQYTINTSDGFGGLGYRFLQHLVDEYPKVTHLVAGATWGEEQEQEQENVADTCRLARLRKMNLALSIVMLSQHASLLVPILPPKQKPTPSLAAAAAAEKNWTNQVDRIQLDDMHHTAALVAAHWETATLGSRLKSKPESLPSLVARLNWRKDTKFAHLGGCFPSSLLTRESLSLNHDDPVDAMLASYGYPSRRSHDRRRPPPPSTSQLAEKNASILEQTWLDLSVPNSIRSSKHEQITNRLASPFATSVMARDENIETMLVPTLSAIDRLVQLKEPLGKGLFAPIPYHLPTSFPNFFTNLNRQHSTSSSSSTTKTTSSQHRPKSVSMISSLSTTSSTVYLFRSFQKTFQQVLHGHLPLSSYGLEQTGKDEIREVLEIIESCIDSYNVDHHDQDDDDDDDDDGGIGTDEEEQGGQDSDLDLDSVF